MKHTQGMWEVKHSESKPSFNVIGSVLGGKYKIARCPYLVTGDQSIDKREMEEAEANARLIASAPELLEALKDTLPNIKYRIKELIEAGNDWGAEVLKSVVKIHEAAIAKATGEPINQSH